MQCPGIDLAAVVAEGGALETSLAAFLRPAGEVDLPRLRRRLGIHLPLRTLFEHSTFRDYRAAVTRAVDDARRMSAADAAPEGD